MKIASNFSVILFVCCLHTPEPVHTVTAFRQIIHDTIASINQVRSEYWILSILSKDAALHALHNSSYENWTPYQIYFPQSLHFNSNAFSTLRVL